PRPSSALVPYATLFRSDEPAVEQGSQRGVAEILHAQGLAMLEGMAGAHGVHAPEQLAEAIELIEIARLRGPATAARKQREAKAGMGVERLAVALQRRHHGNLPLGQFQAEAVFFEDRRVAPAMGAVELGDQRCAVLDAHLIDAVFIAV